MRGFGVKTAQKNKCRRTAKRNSTIFARHSVSIRSGLGVQQVALAGLRKQLQVQDLPVIRLAVP